MKNISLDTQMWTGFDLEGRGGAKNFTLITFGYKIDSTIQCFLLKTYMSIL
jgi:hypothetical protein